MRSIRSTRLRAPQLRGNTTTTTTIVTDEDDDTTTTSMTRDCLRTIPRHNGLEPRGEEAENGGGDDGGEGGGGGGGARRWWWRTLPGDGSCLPPEFIVLQLVSSPSRRLIHPPLVLLSPPPPRSTLSCSRSFSFFSPSSILDVIPLPDFLCVSLSPFSSFNPFPSFSFLGAPRAFLALASMHLPPFNRPAAPLGP